MRRKPNNSFARHMGKIFPRGKNLLFLPKNQKKTIFPKKRLKTYYFSPALACQGGQEPSLAPPFGRPWLDTILSKIWDC